MERPPEPPELLENVGLQAGVVDRVPVDVLEGFAVGVARELQVTRGIQLVSLSLSTPTRGHVILLAHLLIHPQSSP